MLISFESFSNSSEGKSFSSSPKEFWSRWHISLSTWLKDYLYVPLGGSRNGKFILILSTMITMLLGGLWHGASWNFVLWGFVHGLAILIHKFMVKNEYFLLVFNSNKYIFSGISNSS